MNERKTTAIVICIIAVLMFCVGCKNNSESTETNNKKYYTETENTIKINTKDPITELNKKVIDIGTFQSAEILVTNLVESGNIEVEIFDIQNEEIVGVVSEEDENKIIFNIPEGLRKYTIHMDARNYIGDCLIEWNIKESKNFELFTSTMGYELEYNPNKFDVVYESNCEKFVYKDNNEIYFKVYSVSKESSENEKDLLKENATQTGLYEISNSSMSGEFTLQNLKEKNMIKRNLIFELSDNSLIILEICEPKDTEKVQTANEHIKNMIQTFVFK